MFKLPFKLNKDWQVQQKRAVGSNFELAVIWADKLKFPAHSHDEYVVSCNVAGNEKLLLDGRAFEAAESCTTLYNPGQIQSGEGTHCLVSLYLDPEFFKREFIATNNIDFGKPIVTDEILHKSFNSLISLVFNNTPGEDLEEEVFQILGCITDRYTNATKFISPNEDDWRIKRVKEILIDQIEYTPSLTALSTEVGLNKLALLRMFTKATGIPPITWQRSYRIMAARLLLKSGYKAVDAAYETGFADQAHLTRLFGRAYGITPAQFAARY